MRPEKGRTFSKKRNREVSSDTHQVPSGRIVCRGNNTLGGENNKNFRGHCEFLGGGGSERYPRRSVLCVYVYVRTRVYVRVTSVTMVNT